MGYESYNFKLKKMRNINPECTKGIFLNMRYLSTGEDTLEKTSDCGYIEVMIFSDNISLRTAKANDKQIMEEIFADIRVLNDIVPVCIYDYQLKQEITFENFHLAIENFNLLRNEFYEFYPNARCPVRCNEVFSEMRRLENKL